MTIADLIDAMAEAGAPMAAISIAVRAIEDERAVLATRRAAAAERKRRERSLSRDSHATVTRQSEDNLSLVSETKVSPRPSSKTQLSHPIHPPLKTPPPFDRFWSVYPKRVSKGAARKAFLKAERQASIEEILAGVVAAKAGRKWLSGFIPDPATWLNAQGWLDEIDATPEPISGRLALERKVQDDANLGTQMVVDEIRKRNAEKVNGRTDRSILGGLGVALSKIEPDAAGASAMVVRLRG